ncbi:MAG TPA: hypothetical protein DCF68_02560 [Cyanothece sp. UBA12306]|nr:hypothetical protein [Cyanothece sp. UBA12306]
MSNSNKSGCGFLPILGTVIVLIGTGVGAYYYFQGGKPSQDNIALQGAQVVPESAFASSFISTNNQDWKQLTQYGTPQTQQAIKNGLEEWEKETFPNTKITFDQDIKPWIDGLTFALLPGNLSSKKIDQNQILLVIGIKDKIKADQFSKKLEKEPEITFEKRDYKGISIVETTNSKGDRFIWALVGDQIVLSEKSETVEQAIDTFKGEPSYAKKPGFKQMVSQRLKLENPLIQVYLPDYSQMMEQTIKSQGREIPATTLKQLKAVESMVMGISAEKVGLHLQAIAKVKPEQIVKFPQSVSGEVLTEFPQNTLAFINGKGINEGWENLVEQSQQEPELKGFVTQVRQGFKTANLEADQDVFGWMDGEFALGILNLKKGGIANLGIGAMMVIETSDRPTAETAIKKLDQMAKFTPFIKLNQSQVGAINLTEWTIPQQGTVLSYGWIANQSFMLTSGTSWATVKTEQKNSSLPQNSKFKDIQNSLPDNNLGYGFLDIEQIIISLDGLPGTIIDPEAKTILESIEGLGMTVTQPNKSTSQVDVILSLKSVIK